MANLLNRLLTGRSRRPSTRGLRRVAAPDPRETRAQNYTPASGATRVKTSSAMGALNALKSGNAGGAMKMLLDRAGGKAPKSDTSPGFKMNPAWDIHIVKPGTKSPRSGGIRGGSIQPEVGMPNKPRGGFRGGSMPKDTRFVKPRINPGDLKSVDGPVNPKMFGGQPPKSAVPSPRAVEAASASMAPPKKKKKQSGFNTGGSSKGFIRYNR